MSSIAKLFIMGNPRSGTSLLRSLLNMHEQLCIAPECGFLLWLHERWRSAVWTEADLVRFADEVAASKKFDTWRLPPDQLKEFLLAHRPEDFAGAAELVYRCYAERLGRSILAWGDKNNYYTAHVREIRSIYPDACFIHIVRDPRDVAASYLELSKASIDSAHRPDLPVDAATIAKDWSAVNDRLLQDLDGAPGVVRIRYEDLVVRPMESIAPVYSMLGLRPLTGMPRDGHVGTLDEPAEFMQWKRKLAGPVDAASVGRFASDLATEQIAAIEREAGPLMKRFGYEPFLHA
ncbi:MAG: sulfotransferase [Flavobacteriales bacterium]|nr:sulfotransferase [Flavobacteriales bacterium]